MLYNVKLIINFNCNNGVGSVNECHYFLHFQSAKHTKLRWKCLQQRSEGKERANSMKKTLQHFLKFLIPFLIQI